jgi:hypothetical protein
MATGNGPRFSALDPATRQQLDELDLLMQRMLALPVDPPEDPAIPPPQPPPVTAVRESMAHPPDERLSTDTSDLSAMRPTPPAPPEAPRRIQDEQIRNKEQPNTEAARRPPPARSEGTQREAVSADFRASDLRVALQSALRIPLPASPVRLAWPLRPLLWINLAFDGSTAWLGPPGRWLRGPAGRSLLGWGGLLLLAAALAWLAWDGIGWTW